MTSVFIHKMIENTSDKHKITRFSFKHPTKTYKTFNATSYSTVNTVQLYGLWCKIQSRCFQK